MLFALSYASDSQQVKVVYVTQVILRCPNEAHVLRGLFRAIFMPSYRNYKEVVFYEQRDTIGNSNTIGIRL